MVINCSVYGCPSRTGLSLDSPKFKKKGYGDQLYTGRICSKTGNKLPSFHRFPTSEPLRQQWISALGLVSSKLKDFKDFSYVCSHHFMASDFKDNSDGQWGPKKFARVLCRDAVPVVKSNYIQTILANLRVKESEPDANFKSVRTIPPKPPVREEKCQCVELRGKVDMYKRQVDLINSGEAIKCLEMEAELARYNQQMTKAQLQCLKQQKTMRCLTDKVHQLMSLNQAEGNSGIVVSSRPNSSLEIGSDITVSTDGPEADIISIVKECEQRNNELMAIIFKQFEEESSNMSQSEQDSIQSGHGKPQDSCVVRVDEAMPDDITDDCAEDESVSGGTTSLKGTSTEIPADTRVLPVGEQSLRNKNVCDICGERCADAWSLKNHRLTHHIASAVKCDICHMNFGSEAVLKLHKGTVHCVLKFPNYCKSIRALAVVNESVSEGRSSPEGTSTKKTTDTRVLPVDVGKGKSLTKNKHVKSAEKIDKTRTKALNSNELWKRFLAQRRRKDHKLRDQCTICHVNFNCRAVLKRHMSVVHKAELCGPELCDVCGKSFSTKKIMAQHRILHKDPNAYRCDICQKQLSSLDNLRYHKDSHKKEQGVLKCPSCPQQFRNVYTWRFHQLKHLFRCETCYKRIITQRTLRSDMTNIFALKGQLCVCGGKGGSV